MASRDTRNNRRIHETVTRDKQPNYNCKYTKKQQKAMHETTTTKDFTELQQRKMNETAAKDERNSRERCTKQQRKMHETAGTWD
jgi:hypothetical protein